MDIDEMVNDYGERLLRYATSILYNHHDAEDIVQDVILSAYQNQGKFDGSNLSAWLYKITYNKCMNKLKWRKFLVFADIPENTVSTADTGLSDGTLQALSHLSHKDRALLYARIVEGYSYEELSQQMGQSPAALRKRYERAKTRLAQHLNFNLSEKGVVI